MKKLLLLFFVSLLLNRAAAQSQPAPLIWGASAFQDSLWAIDTSNWVPTINVEALVTNSVVTGINGLAFDPTSYKTYAILKINSNTRHLAEISLPSGSCTIMGDLGDKFSSITFDKFGQLWGATGDGANAPETLYKIDKATAASTLVFAMGNGADGEVICYNRFDNKMYHWSGNGTLVFESWPLASTSYTPQNIVTSGTTGGETFGALCLRPNDFIISNIASNFKHLSSTGNYGNSLITNPDDLRGLVMPPRFAVNTQTVCAKSGSVNLFSNCLQQFDSVYYYWGDGAVSQLLASSAVTAAASHTYANAGNYTLTVQLYNGTVAKSTIRTFTIVVANSPSVTIAGPTNICPNSTITLTGSGGGTSQWRLNGVNIPGATAATLAVSSPGWYNMTKTNQNGCSDSAAVGVLVKTAPAPTVSATGTMICQGNTVVINPAGASTYTISGGSFTVTPAVSTSYSVTGTSTAGCVSQNTAVITITVNALPQLTVSASNPSICAGESSTLSVSGASLYSWSNSSTLTNVVVSPSVTTTYSVTGTDLNGCASTATVSQSVSACTGISENIRRSAVQLSPNPNTGRFEVSNLPAHSVVEVFNAIGQCVLSQQVSGNSFSADLSQVAVGIYVVRVSQQGAVIAEVKMIRE